MNVYVVKTNEERGWHEAILDDGSGPTEYYWPHELFAAETASQAKYDALKSWSHKGGLQVYSDDYPNLRAILVGKNVPLERGLLPDTEANGHYWLAYEVKLAALEGRELVIEEA